jgi:hypothetical protein
MPLSPIAGRASAWARHAPAGLTGASDPFRRQRHRPTLATHRKPPREAGEAIPTQSVKFGACRPAG